MQKIVIRAEYGLLCNKYGKSQFGFAKRVLFLWNMESNALFMIVLVL